MPLQPERAQTAQIRFRSGAAFLALVDSGFAGSDSLSQMVPASSKVKNKEYKRSLTPCIFIDRDTDCQHGDSTFLGRTRLCRREDQFS
jgi:hypothetical protein